MSEKAKAMMERLKNSPVSMENGKQDANVRFTSHIIAFLLCFSFLLYLLTLLSHSILKSDFFCFQFNSIFSIDFPPPSSSSLIYPLNFSILPSKDERQARLRDHARRLIAETKAKSGSLESPTSPVKSITQRITLSPERTISPINNTDTFSFGHTTNNKSNSKENSPSKQQQKRITPPRDMENNHSNSPNQNIVFSEKNGNSPSLQSFNAVLESLTPQHEKKVCKMNETYELPENDRLFVVVPDVVHRKRAGSFGT